MLLFRRDTCEKMETALNDAEAVKALLADIQKKMYEKAEKRMKERIIAVDTLEDLLFRVDGGNFVRAGWCGERACEDKVKEYSQATARVISEENTIDTCICCRKKSKHTVFFARAY